MKSMKTANIAIGGLLLLVVAPVAAYSLSVHDYNRRAELACGPQPAPETAAERDDAAREAAELQRAVEAGPEPFNLRVERVAGHRAFLTVRQQAPRHHVKVDSPETEEAKYLGEWLTIMRAHHSNEDYRGRSRSPTRTARRTHADITAASSPNASPGSRCSSADAQLPVETFRAGGADATRVALVKRGCEYRASTTVGVAR